MILVAIPLLISGGPVLFTQRRIGQGGKAFTMVKFRTMTNHGNADSIFEADDSSVTNYGRFLRKSKLDEIPEIWNVVQGDMSLVGPRPEVSTYVNDHDKKWQFVLNVAPGITDPVSLKLWNEEKTLDELAEIHSTDRDTVYRNILLPYKLDLQIAYLNNRSWKSDLVVLWKTLIRAVGFGLARESIPELSSTHRGDLESQVTVNNRAADQQL